MLNSTYAKSQFKYEIYLCESSTPYNIKGCLTTASTNRKFKWQLRNVHEMTLTIPEKFEDGTDNSLFDSVEKTNVIKVEKWIGDEITEIFMYHIAEITIASDVHQYKDIKAYSLEERWNNFNLRNFTYSTQLYTGTGWNSATPADSGIMDYILGFLKNTWTVEYISSGLVNSVRKFDISSAKLLDAVRIIENNFNCIFIFDTYRHSIDIVEYGDVLYVGGLNTNTGLILDHKNYVDQYKSQMDIDEIVTRLYVYGSEGTNISSVNVMGTTYIDDFSFFMNTRYMTQGLIDALTTLTALRESKYTEYTGLLAQLTGKQIELANLQIELIDLQNELIILEDNQDYAIKNGGAYSSTPYSTWQSLIVAKKAEIAAKEGDIAFKEIEIDIINGENGLLATLVDSLSYETNLTEAQNKELLNFIKEDEITFETDVPAALVQLGWDYLEIKAKTSYDIGVNVTDILSSKADSFMWNKIRLGHKVNLLIPYTTDGSGGTQAEYPYDPDPDPVYTEYFTMEIDATSEQTFEVPLDNSYDYHFIVYWGDGNTEVITTNSNVQHIYDSPGTYTIKIDGEFPHIWFKNLERVFGGGSHLMVTDVSNWGAIKWQTMEGAFYSCANMDISATDTPDLTNVESLEGMFEDCSMNADIGSWDVSGVKNLNHMFDGAWNFNQDISAWNVSNVTSMSWMFYDCPFNQNINAWDMSNVQDMSYMFYEAWEFNQPVNFNTTNAINMSYMFANCDSLNQNIILDTGNAQDISYMFTFCTSLNSTINIGDTTNVTNMEGMFYYCSVFNQSVSFLKTDGATNLSYLFSECWVFNQPVSHFNTSNVTNMAGMFSGCMGFNQSIDNFDTSKVTDMNSMLSAINSTFSNISVSNFDTSNVTNMAGMFAYSNNFNKSLSNFDTSNVTNMRAMFRSCSSFNQPLDNFDTGKVTTMSYMFQSATAFDFQLSSFDTSNVTTMESMFAYADSFNQSLNNFDTGKVTTMRAMFQGADSFNQVLTFNTSEVTDMSYMFRYADSFNQSLAAFDTSKVEYMRYMFDNADVFNQNISGFDVSALKDADYMLRSTAFSNVNYDLLLVAWAAQTVLSGVDFHAGTAQYSAGIPATAKASLQSAGWTITDGGVAP